jgi:LysM repeat protein
MATIKLLMLLILSQAINQTAVQDTTIQHQVKSGETLHSITRHYLGTDILWQENWKLNPHITNPNMLTIGEELTIIKERIIPAEKARILDVTNRVEKKPITSDWKSTHAGDELVQQEGVRTYEKSSALLAFNNDSTLKVLEYSQIFLQSRNTSLTGTDSATIEIIKGDTELNWEPLANQISDITIVIGQTLSKPTLKQGETTELRTGMTAQGNSVISVYQGNSAVESAGSQVQVKQGMGVAVKPGEIPPKPQKLLAAPQANISQSVYDFTNPILSWQPVDNATDYVVELCADALCSQVLNEAKVNQLHWQNKHIEQAGDFYFRVAARSDQQLVGYRSKPIKITFTQAVADNKAPHVAIELLGKKNTHQQQFTISPNTTFKIHAFDALSGLHSLKYRWNDAPWTGYTGQALHLTAGEGTLYIEATDQLGHAATHEYHFINSPEPIN